MADYARFNLRFAETDDDLRVLLEESAARNNRSLHGEIMARLRASFEPALADRVQELEKQVAALGKRK